MIKWKWDKMKLLQTNCKIERIKKISIPRQNKVSNRDRDICGGLRQNLDVHFDDFLIGHGSRIPRSDINPKLSGTGARTDEPSEQEINYIDLDEPRPRFPRFPRLRRLHQPWYVASFYCNISVSAMGELYEMNSKWHQYRSRTFAKKMLQSPISKFMETNNKI